MEAVYVGLYKSVSAVAVVLENLSKPALSHAHGGLLTLSRRAFGAVYWSLEGLLDLGLQPTGLVRLVRECQKLLYFTQSTTYAVAVASCDWLEAALTDAQTWFEAYFEEHGFAQQHWAFSLRHRALVKEVLQLLSKDTAELRLLPTALLIRLTLFYMILQRRVRALTWRPAYSPQPHQDASLADLSYFSKFAIGVYGHFLTIVCKGQTEKFFSQMSEQEILLEHAHLNARDLVYTDFDSDVPAHVICLDHESRSILLVIRGSLSVMDFIVDANCHYEQYTALDPVSGSALATGYVHGGMMLSTRGVHAKVKAKLISLTSKLPTYQLIVTGHSLGAGVAGLMLLLWLSDPEMANLPYRGLTYASPQIVSQNLNKLLESRLLTCLIGNDLVPRLSLGSCRDLSQVFVALNNLEVGVIQKQQAELRPSALLRALVTGQDVPDSTFLALAQTLEPQMNSMKLQPGGRLFQTYPRDYDEGSVFCKGYVVGLQSEKYIGAFVTCSEYDRLVLSTTMFSDHVPLLYEQVITALAPPAPASVHPLRIEPNSARLPDTELTDEEVDTFLKSISVA